MRQRVLRIILVGVVVVAVVTGVGALRRGVTGNDIAVLESADRDESATRTYGSDEFKSGGEEGSSSAGSGGMDFAEDAGFAPVAMESGSGVTVGGGSSVGGGGAGQAAAQDYSAPASVPAPPPSLGLNERIIKDGRVEIEVARNGFDRGYAQVLALATKVGGTVVQSQSTRQEDQASGEVTIRVPADRFEDLLTSTGGIGKILHRSIESSDVSGEFVDLGSRLRHLEAQERFFMDLMSKARTVGDAVAINQNLSTVQAEKEQVQGRLRLLDEKTTYSRLTIALHEPGATPLISQVPMAPRGVLAQAWADSVGALQQTIGALLIGAFTLAPLALLALLAWAVWRRLRPRPALDPRQAEAPSEGPVSVG
jgi:hypothetical protein